MSAEPTGFLYPFIEEEETDESGLLKSLAESAEQKMLLSRSVRDDAAVANWDVLARAAAEMARRFRAGGRLLAFGNGGSSTDADGAVELFTSPPSGSSLPALSLVHDSAVLTALGNDVGFDLIFSRQVIAYGCPDDVAMGFSTSGDSVNVNAAFEEAARRGMLTIGFSGYDGGAMAASPAVSHCLVVGSESVHRIQEAQDALLFELWGRVQSELAGEAMGQ